MLNGVVRDTDHQSIYPRGVPVRCVRPPGEHMTHRSHAAAATAAVLLGAIAGATPASASPHFDVKLVTPSQTALVRSEAAVARVFAPARSVAGLDLFSDGKRVAPKQTLSFRHARTARVVVPLTDSAIKALEDCEAHVLDLRLTVRHAGRTTVVRDHRALELDSRRCDAPPAPPAKQP